MTRINLLPWREELREEKRKEFVQFLALALLVAGLGLFGAGTWISGKVERQDARNAYVQEEIDRLDQRIAEIRQLERRRRELLARMRVIQELQGNRPVIVRIFDQLVRTLADGVFYTQLQLDGSTIQVSGVAEANDRVSALMRRLDESEWFTAPNLRGLREATQYGAQASTFDLSFEQTLPQRDDEEG